jgi:simple sugar transport system permease protein
MFFSVLSAIGIRAQLVFGDSVPHDLIQALPYLATVFGLWLSSRLRGGSNGGITELRDN